MSFSAPHTSSPRALRWMRLDNAAKIYPAARRETWSNIFRLSVTLKAPVHRPTLQAALDAVVPRFPSIAARLRRGVFWYYLQELSQAPRVQEERSYPLAHMSGDEIRHCAFRVIAYENRIAVEFFHALTDGTGALIFLKTLTAEYLRRQYGLSIPAEQGILDIRENPRPEELEDSFPVYAGLVPASRRERTAWHLQGTPEPGGFLRLTCFRLSVSSVLEMARKYNVTVTAFLCAVMIDALQTLQAEKIPNPRRRRPIKVLLPVNLRALFPSETLRNFALYTTPEIDPRLGHHSFEELCAVARHRMGLDITPKQMGTRIATNVRDERSLFIKLIPLPLKNLVMKAVFDSVGERKSCLSLSNLGAVKLPEAMTSYVERLDFILGPQASAPHNCGVISFGDTLCINFIRTIQEPELELHFFRSLQRLGLPAQVQSNNE